ncbi:MAG: hypothetical protein IPO92_08460 [Saprospiraceae bacterium]|nr:hypothetical protein [Saprospiraceae bacterium]
MTNIKYVVQMWVNVIFVLCLTNIGYTQMTMHNFTVTDSDGATHNLYTSYLDQGKTVVIKFFFTTCPPCISIAPVWQQKYVQWGSGNNDVEFIEASILGSDTNVKVGTYKSTYGLTMKGVGANGNASAIFGPFQSGTYGSWYGTPSFAVIAPNRTLNYAVAFADLDAAILATGAQMPGSGVPDPTTVNLNLQTYNVDIPDGHVKFYIKPQNYSEPKIEILKNNQGQYSFVYPSVNVPTMENPEIVMESVGPDYTSKISAADIVVIQKHILGLELMSPAYKLIAADVNKDNKITASDLVTMRKLILGLISDFPNNNPSYVNIPATQPVLSNPGQTVNIDMSVIKIGNVN